jgi:hypothetical protein
MRAGLPRQAEPPHCRAVIAEQRRSQTEEIAMSQFASFDDFWPHYLRAHAHAETRALHFLGTSIALVCLIVALAVWRLDFVVLALFIGYGLAWAGHYVFERNGPATFSHPLKSLRGDLTMLGLWLSGRLRPELRKAGIVER